MQVLSVTSRAFWFCFKLVFAKAPWGKSTWLLLTRKSKVAIQDVTPSALVKSGKPFDANFIGRGLAIQDGI